MAHVKYVNVIYVKTLKSVPAENLFTCKYISCDASSPPMLHNALGIEFPIHTRNTCYILFLAYFIPFKSMVPKRINKQRDLFLNSKTRA